MDNFEHIAKLSLQGAAAIGNPILALPWEWVVAVGFLGISGWLIGGRLALIVKPDRPFLSPLIRKIGVCTKTFGLLTSIGTSGWCLLVLFLLFLHQVFVGTALTDSMQLAWSTLWKAGRMHLIGTVSGAVAGLALSLPLIWRVIPEWERGGGMPDVQELVTSFKKLNGFDPIPYINIKRGCFIGCDKSLSPIYVPWAKLRETHIQILGTTGSGKGVVMSLIAYQCVLAGECVIWFDPKFDRYSPRILKAAAKRAGRKFHIINLSPGSEPQVNPLKGASEYQIDELLVSTLDLRNAGNVGDFYRGKDQDAAAAAARVAVETGELSLPGLFKACSAIQNIVQQENFWRQFRKLATFSAVNTKGGLDLDDAMSRGDVIYIIGSCDNERVKMLQKMLLVRIMQIIKSRNRLLQHAPTCIVADEFKHMLSSSALTSLGVIRDYDAHMLLAHQSNGDLNACAGIDPVEVQGAVIDNTAIKIVFRIGDDQYAERLSRISGKRRTYLDNAAKQLDETGESAGSWREDKVYHIDMDLLTHLPMPSDRPNQASVGVLFGIGNARLFHVGPIPVTGEMPTPTPAEPYSSTVNGNLGSEGLI
jgi:hypothetical protein